MCYDDHTRIIDLTVGELRQVLSEKMQAEEQALHEVYEGYLKSKKTKESPYDEKIEGIRRTRRVG